MPWPPSCLIMQSAVAKRRSRRQLRGLWQRSVNRGRVLQGRRGVRCGWDGWLHLACMLTQRQKNVVALWYLKFVCALQISFHFIPLRVDLSKRCNWCGRRISVCLCVCVCVWVSGSALGVVLLQTGWHASLDYQLQSIPIPIASTRLCWFAVGYVVICRFQLSLPLSLVVACVCCRSRASGYIGWELSATKSSILKLHIESKTAEKVPTVGSVLAKAPS